MTLQHYVIGFVVSLALTLGAYFMVIGNHLTGLAVLIGLGVLAVIQMIVQLYYFLHLGGEARPRYRLASFLFMALILFIIVAGSIWIMSHLDYNMMNMAPGEKDDYMKTQFNKGF